MDRHRAQLNFDMVQEMPPAESHGTASGVRVVALLPTDEMRAAKVWLETIASPPTVDDDLLAIHGWLCPAGKLYACGWEKHNDLTRALGYAHESDIEKAGFCKLSQLRWLVQPRYCARPLTDAQWGTIERWYEKNGFPEEHFLRLTALL